MLVRMPTVGERWRASSNWKLLTSNTITSGSPAFASMRSAKARPKLKPIFPAKTQSFSPLMMWWQRVAVVVLPLLPVTATMGAAVYSVAQSTSPINGTPAAFTAFTTGVVCLIPGLLITPSAARMRSRVWPPSSYSTPHCSSSALSEALKLPYSLRKARTPTRAASCAAPMPLSPAPRMAICP